MNTADHGSQKSVVGFLSVLCPIPAPGVDTRIIEYSSGIERQTFLFISFI